MIQTKKTIPNKKNTKRVCSLILIAALLITGAFAFLTATDSKTNVFTIGNVNIKLYEDDWYDHDTGAILDDENDNTIPDFAENLVPGDIVDKAPYVENTGANDAWVYLTVSIPTANRADLANPATLNQALGDNISGVKIDINAYAIQDKYDSADNDTAREVWDAYVGTSGSPAAIDYTEMFGASVVPTSDRTELFELIGLDVDRTIPAVQDDPNTPEDESQEAQNISGNWTLLDTYYGADGNNYYVYAYKTKLAPDDDANAVPAVSDETSELFTAVKLNSAIGNAYTPPISNTGVSDSVITPLDDTDILTLGDDDTLVPVDLPVTTQYFYIKTGSRRITRAAAQQMFTFDEDTYTVNYISSRKNNTNIFGSGARFQLVNKSTGNIDYEYILVVPGDVNGDSSCSANDVSIADQGINNPDSRWYVRNYDRITLSTDKYHAADNNNYAYWEDSSNKIVIAVENHPTASDGLYVTTAIQDNGNQISGVEIRDNADVSSISVPDNGETITYEGNSFVKFAPLPATMDGDFVIAARIPKNAEELRQDALNLAAYKMAADIGCSSNDATNHLIIDGSERWYSDGILDENDYALLSYYVLEGATLHYDSDRDAFYVQNRDNG